MYNTIVYLIGGLSIFGFLFGVLLIGTPQKVETLIFVRIQAKRAMFASVGILSVTYAACYLIAGFLELLKQSI